MQVLCVILLCAGLSSLALVDTKDWIDDYVKHRTQASLKLLETDFMSVFKKYVIEPAKAKAKLQAKAPEQLKKVLAKVDRRRGLEDIRVRRSGSCNAICRHRCLPECDFACCVTFPVGYSRRKVQAIEAQASIKADIMGTKKDVLKKYSTEYGSRCDAGCFKHCSPTCKFRCCIRTPRP